MAMSREGRNIAIGAIVLGGVGVGAALLLRKPSSAPTGQQGASATQVPQVAGLSATQQGTAWALTWQAVTVSGQTVSYTVQRLDTGATVTTASTSYSFTSLTGPTPVQVTACVGSGASQVCGTTSATYTIPAQAQLPQVTGITTTASGTSATISWQPVQGVQGVQYAIRHVDAAGNSVQTNMGNAAPQVTVTQTSITISQLTAGATLHFQVAATLAGQVGPFSSVQAVTIPAQASGGGGGGPIPVNSACQSLWNAWQAIGTQMDALRAAHPDCFQGYNAPGSYCANIVAQYQALATRQAQAAAAYNKCAGFGG